MLAILSLVLPSLSRPSLTLDPLIAEARSHANERRTQVARRSAAALIVGVTLACVAFLQQLRLVEDLSPRQLLVLVLRFVHPWWLYTAILALCLLGAAGTANVLPTARRAITSGYAAASALFVAAGLAALADTKLVYAGIAGTNFGPTNLAVTFLLLGLVSAALALTCWARQRK
jgi:cation transport ATPase